MRTFYIFNVNREMSVLTKDSPYMLYKSLELIYKGRREDFRLASNVYDQIASTINKNFSVKFMEAFKDNDFYMCHNNKHSYYNKYRDESCEMEVKNSYIICKTNYSKPIFFEKLNDLNCFICDFENRDYFWLNEIYC